MASLIEFVRYMLSITILALLFFVLLVVIAVCLSPSSAGGYRGECIKSHITMQTVGQVTIPLTVCDITATPDRR